MFSHKEHRESGACPRPPKKTLLVEQGRGGLATAASREKPMRKRDRYPRLRKTYGLKTASRQRAAENGERGDFKINGEDRSSPSARASSPAGDFGFRHCREILYQIQRTKVNEATSRWRLAVVRQGAVRSQGPVVRGQWSGVRGQESGGSMFSHKEQERTQRIWGVPQTPKKNFVNFVPFVAKN